MNKILLLFPILLITFAFVSATYYETADSYSSVEGMWQPEGSYIIDGDWGTGANVDWGGCSSADAVLISTYNFTEGSEIISAVWEVKDKGETRNISVPSDCISSNGIILKVFNEGDCYEIPFEPPVYEYDNTITYSCYDFVLNDWQQLISPIGFYITSYGDVFYEEGLYLELVEPIEPEPEQQTNNNLEVVITQSPAPIFSALDLGTFSSINTDGISDWAKDNKKTLLIIGAILLIFIFAKKK